MTATQNNFSPSTLDEIQLEVAFAVAEIFDRHKIKTLPEPSMPPPPRELFLKEWRHARAKVEGVRHYRIFSNRTLKALAARDPKSIAELAEVSGIGPKKLETMGHSLVDALTNFRTMTQPS